MRILMQARHDLFEQGGGDRTQILKTKDALERLGHQVTLATAFVKDLSDYDLVHLFNLTVNTQTLFLNFIHAKQQRKPVVLSTIYWNPQEWLEKTPAEYRATGKGNRWLDLFNYLFKSIPITELLRLLATSSDVRRWIILPLRYPGKKNASQFVRRHIIAGVDAILPNGVEEGKEVERDFGKAKRVFSIPNGVDDDFESITAESFIKEYKLQDFALSVGRIESRKNILPLVKAAKKMKLQLVFIGSEKIEPEYAKAVREEAADGTLFIPEMPYEQLGSAYKAAKVHALSSWFETPGLSALEAGLAGCNIVITDKGTTHEHFADLAWYCNPNDQRSIEKALAAAQKAPKTQKLRAYILSHFTWDHVAAATEKAYKATVSEVRAS